MATIYLLYSEDGEKVYIGSTINYKRRMNQHFVSSKIDTHDCTSFILMMEYGKTNVKHRVLEECILEDRYVREQYWLEQYPTKVNKMKSHVLQRNVSKEKSLRTFIRCECGRDISLYNLNRHVKRNVHKNNLVE